MSSPSVLADTALVDLTLSFDEAIALSGATAVISRLCEGQFGEIASYRPGRWERAACAVLDGAAATVVGSTYPGSYLSIGNPATGREAQCMYELHCALRYTIALLRDPSGKSIRGTVIQRPHLPVSSLPLPTASPLARATGDSSMDSAANSVRITLTFAHARAAALACDARVMLQEGRWSDLVRALFSWRLDADSMELMAVQLERAQEFAGSEGPPFHGAAEVDQLLHLAALCGGTRGF